ncbi:hypothetical protein Ciccas_007608 [Cichlidogyrus casuarinus]|uniref:Helicase ATP-binding domain-containing protein n=1 Tax=Cichlidogyrus casuarinus TaxID=1844966 RepID=A0ABD2Q327_9PLAT
MPILNLNGIQIDFPYESYECQQEYMRYLILAMEQSRNALLESPTGTGKTLCLICASLAWIQAQKNKFTHISESNSFLVASNIPRIIFASRTHSQLLQAVQALKKTSYRQ